MHMTFDLSQQPSVGGLGLGFRVPVPRSTCHENPELPRAWWSGLQCTWRDLFEKGNRSLPPWARGFHIPGQFVSPGLRSGGEEAWQWKVDRRRSFLGFMRSGEWGWRFAAPRKEKDAWLGLMSILVTGSGLDSTHSRSFRRKEGGSNDWSLPLGRHLMVGFHLDHRWLVERGVSVTVSQKKYIEPDVSLGAYIHGKLQEVENPTGEQWVSVIPAMLGGGRSPRQRAGTEVHAVCPKVRHVAGQA